MYKNMIFVIPDDVLNGEEEDSNVINSFIQVYKDQKSKCFEISVNSLLLQLCS